MGEVTCWPRILGVDRCRPVARGGRGGGGVGGVPTPPSGINDIHNFNCLIQERPFDCF